MFRLSKRIVIFFILFLVNNTNVSYSQEINQAYIQKFDNIEINWTDNKIKIKSIGVPSDRGTLPQRRLFAQRMAKLNANKKLMEFINNIKVNSELVVKDIINQDEIKSKINNFIRETKSIEVNNLSNGSVEVILEINLFNQSARDIKGNLINDDESLASIILNEKIIKSGKKSDLKPIDFKEKYSGLIIDCRDFKLEPALLPSILDEKNNKVYLDNDNFNLKNIINFSPVAYYNSFSEAKKSPRVGDNPLIVKPIKISGEYKTDIILGNETLKKILGINSINKILDENRVIILL
ncbi:MAG: hypothetical protein KatS3mg068_0563 [Candidatus Sericytochromatia bacterium]|nr:MAG: hypothetical protein KatS3mg068_0563 [Candidatus Sericytochromatia bacterium]